MNIVNMYYKYVDQVTKEIVVYLEVALISQIDAKPSQLDPEMLVNVISIKKINEEFHKEPRISFLCDRFLENLFLMNVRNGSFTISEEDEKPKLNKNKELEESPFAESFK